MFQALSPLPRPQTAAFEKQQKVTGSLGDSPRSSRSPSHLILHFWAGCWTLLPWVSSAPRSRLKLDLGVMFLFSVLCLFGLSSQELRASSLSVLMPCPGSVCHSTSPGCHLLIFTIVEPLVTYILANQLIVSGEQPPLFPSSLILALAGAEFMSLWDHLQTIGLGISRWRTSTTPIKPVPCIALDSKVFPLLHFPSPSTLLCRIGGFMKLNSSKAAKEASATVSSSNRGWFQCGFLSTRQRRAWWIKNGQGRFCDIRGVYTGSWRAGGLRQKHDTQWGSEGVVKERDKWWGHYDVVTPNFDSHLSHEEL